jgi:DNA polymerase III subunit gamma/tau
MSEPQSLSKLTEAARSFFGREFQWSVKAKAAPAPREAPKSKRTKGNPRRSIMEHPVVMQALEILGGELIDIRPLKHHHPDGPTNDPSKETEGGQELH